MDKKKLLLLSVLLFLAFGAEAQRGINESLKIELDSIYVLDQKYRHLLSLKKDIKKADSIATFYQIPKKDLESFLWSNQEKIDVSNLVRIEEIVEQYGYPGKTLVGTSTNEAAYFVLQHSSKIKQYLPYIKKAVKKGELPFFRYAMMQDRFLMQEEKEQIYGTQIYGLKVNNHQTGKEEWKMFVWPIKKPGKVNKRRKQVGFEQTEEQYAKRFDIEYKIVTMEEVKKMKEK